MFCWVLSYEKVQGSTMCALQVEGKAGFPALVSKVRTSGPTVLYHGAIAASVATFVGVSCLLPNHTKPNLHQTVPHGLGVHGLPVVPA